MKEKSPRRSEAPGKFTEEERAYRRTVYDLRMPGKLELNIGISDTHPAATRRRQNTATPQPENLRLNSAQAATDCAGNVSKRAFVFGHEQDRIPVVIRQRTVRASIPGLVHHALANLPSITQVPSGSRRCGEMISR
jgi:hypothetical protein